MDNPFLEDMLAAFPSAQKAHDLKIDAGDDLPSWFETSALATASLACAGTMLALLLPNPASALRVNTRLTGLWFGLSMRPQGWEGPSVWDAVAGDYQTADGWIRLHTNAAHHRDAALSVLKCNADREAVQKEVAKWQKTELQDAIVAANGCAAAMHTIEQWKAHPQGTALSQEPLIHWDIEPDVTELPPTALKGCKVLDLTRVLAGPTATRFLAGYGAEVLRIDPIDWEEPGVIIEVTLGKRCAGLDLNAAEDRAVFENLVKDADIIVHGYRADALEAKGLGVEDLRKINPALISVSLNAFGWTGPWKNRRGFDSLVQMSSGIAAHGMEQAGADKPMPLPVQALDLATGYLMAAAALHALHRRNTTGAVMSARLSLAATAQMLLGSKRNQRHQKPRSENADDLDPRIEDTVWGPLKRIKFPLTVDGQAPLWPHPAGELRSSEPKW